MPTTANKVKFNLKNVHYAINNGDGTFATPVAIPGAVNLSLEPQGDSYVFYADGVRYFEYATNDGYEGDLEIALIPQSFRTAILKEILDSNQNLVELDDVNLQDFALGFQIDGDQKETCFWFYDCVAARPTTSAKTKEASTEVDTETLSLTAKPDVNIDVTSNGKTVHPVRIRSTEETNTASWFSAVVTPNMPATVPAG